MKMSSVFKTLFATTGLLAVQTGATQSANAAVYTFNDPVSTTFQTYKTIGLSDSVTNPSGEKEHMSLMIPSRDELAKYKAVDYNAVIAPMRFAEKSVDSYGRGEYGAFVIAKDKRHLLTPQLIKDPEKLKEFLNQKDIIIEIDRGLSQEKVSQLFEANKDKKASIDPSKTVALGMVGG